MKIIVIFFFIPLVLLAQQKEENLLENGSFEAMDLKGLKPYLKTYSLKSPQDFERRNPAWFAPWSSKPALVDSTIRSIINGKTYGKVLTTLDGRYFINLCVHGGYGTTTPRDYVGQKLKRPLKKGVTYQIEVDAARSFWVAINKLGFFFTENPVQTDAGKDWKGQPIQPQVVFDSILCKVPMQWYKLSATFQLNKDAEYMYFGNFATLNTYKVIYNALNNACVTKGETADYYFDNFRLVEVSPSTATMPISAVPDAPIAKKKEKMVLNNMLFETNKANLKTNDLSELEELCAKMLQNARWTLLITGHTDNVGGGAYNQQLSEQRAHTIAQYLQTKGIAASRIQKRGVGATQPIADNQTEEGREKNRRVEIEVTQY